MNRWRTKVPAGTGADGGGAPTVLQVVPELATGGAEKSAVEIAAALARLGARTLVASRGGRLVADLAAAGGIWIPFPADTKNPLRLIANIFALVKLIRRENVRLIHARSRAPAWSALAAARIAAIPFVTTYHGAYGGTGRVKTFYNSIMARGDKVIANSHFTATLVRQRHAPPQGRLVVVHRGVDLDLFDPAKIDVKRFYALREAWGLTGNGAPILLLPARLTFWKGQETAICAARLLVERGIGDFVMVLAGSDQGRALYSTKLRRLIRDLGVENQVRLVGHCADMAAANRLAAVTLVPSTEPEAFGRTAAEAQAMGTPVIASALGAVCETVLAPPEVAEDARTGWRVTPGDPAALADAIAAALALPGAAREAMGARGRAHVLANFSTARMQAGTLDVYDSLLGTALGGAFRALAGTAELAAQNLPNSDILT